LTLGEVMTIVLYGQGRNPHYDAFEGHMLAMTSRSEDLNGVGKSLGPEHLIVAARLEC